MKVAFFSIRDYDKPFFEKANEGYGHTLRFFEQSLNPETAKLSQGCEAVCAFVQDDLSRKTLQALKKHKISTVALRCSGFNQVDLQAAKELQFTILTVPKYSPHAVAEHAVALMLSLNRKIPKAWSHTKEGNFSLSGLMGFDMFKKTAGIIGTGYIGSCLAEILHGFGCEILAYDPKPNPSLKRLITYTSLREIWKKSDIISLHCPLNEQTKHLISAKVLLEMKPGVMLINTSRGALLDTHAVIEALKQKQLGYLGIDVYEEEENLFSKDLSSEIIQDDTFSRLLTFPNVIVTSHQAYFTKEALQSISQQTLAGLSSLEKKEPCENVLWDGSSLSS